MSVPLQAVLFDHDGTLVDSELIHFQLWLEVLQSFGVSLSLGLYKERYAGLPTPANAADMVARFKMKLSAVELADAKNLITSDFLARGAFPLMPGAHSAVESFNGFGLKMAVVTGGARHGVDASLKEHALSDYFDTIVSCDDVRASKPSPDCYLLALERLGLPAQACVAIEDTEAGLKAAKAAGLICLAIPTLISKHQNFSAAEKTFHGMDEATRWVKRQIAAR